MRAFTVYGWMMSLLLFLLCFCYASSYLVDGYTATRSRGGNSLIIKYDRINEVTKECSSILPFASDVKPANDIVYNLKEELSFLNGDWWQESNKAPFLPFDNRDFSNYSSPDSVVSTPPDLGSPSNLVSFWVTDVSSSHRPHQWVAVNGAMVIGTTIQGLFMEMPYEGSNFDIWPGNSHQTILFQGFYAESDKNGGERVMCLLGNAKRPSRGLDSSDPWEGIMQSGRNNRPSLVQDDRILLVLRYPKAFTLLNRRIRGSMKSLHPKSEPKYFDEVGMSSWLAVSANYEFGSEEIVSRACDPYPFKDNLMNGAIDVFKGLDICVVLEKFTRQEALRFVPNAKCNGSDEYCSKLGPFKVDKEFNSFRDINLVIQDFRCAEESVPDEDGFRRISSVFRAFPSSEEKFFASQKSNLNNMTLSAEGIWKSSSGQVCMVGCLGRLDGERSDCNHRICLYIPLSFSLKQRSILVGTISSVDESTTSYFPLTFQKLARLGESWDQLPGALPHYNYSKIDAAGVMLEKSEPFNFGDIVKQSLLKFPKLTKAESDFVSHSLLSEDLTLHLLAFPDTSPKSFFAESNFQLEILTLGPMFGRSWYQEGLPVGEEKVNPTGDNVEYSEKQLLINVSAQIGLTGKLYENFSVIFVEGLYHPVVGKMYLIGCRDVQASWKTLHESMDLEDGLDCRVEVIVSYPPTTSRWLVNPTATISISSQRNEDDPLYFTPIKLQTSPVMYRKQREDILSRRGVEGLLRILTLSLAIACLLSQIYYIRANLESVPYISLVMLGIQGVGYSIPLITGAEAIFEKMSSEPYSYQPYGLEKSQAIRAVEYTVKLLVLAAFSLTMRLCQKVWRSRIRLLTRAPLEPHRVPSDKRVLIPTSIIHFLGYILVLFVHYLSSSQYRSFQSEKYIDSSGQSRTLREWETELEEYLGLIQDFFLLPQIIGNYIWKLNGKPLRKFYYMGITAVRLLPHLYDFLKSPIPNPYFSNEYEFVNPRRNFFSKFGDIAIPFIAALLAVVVYVQQRWNYAELSRSLSGSRASKVYERLGSKVYERLPSLSSISFEAELSSGVNEVIANENRRDQD
ncbi:OLC1v1014676C1 [Oldenlandia corymbosa var. corymbosa]|uniref:RING-type E3 ubiquitin transferase n=1 Tax=Oldenlandia corymbosa var. corymbosa TaxID=529605 RepID=A0AAV1E1T3_OLDCO|nr:OLC1v1014676C1 [Oldenlandia corymbosa var. corymbosa]